METIVILFGIAVVLLVIGKVVRWAGPCKKCKSNDNWLEEEVSTYPNSPDMELIVYQSHCLSCDDKIPFENKLRRTRKRK